MEIEPRKLAPAAAVIVVAFLLLLPLFWPTPQVTIEVPDVARLDGQAHVVVTVRAWHPNVEIQRAQLNASVRWRGEGGRHAASIEPVVLHMTSPSRSVWSFWEVSRLTWPRSRTFRIPLPLTDLSELDLPQPGVVSGTLHVTVIYPGVGLRFGSSGRGFLPRYTAHPVEGRSPFRLEIQGTDDRGSPRPAPQR